MAFQYTGTGGLFTRLGQIFGGIRDIAGELLSQGNSYSTLKSVGLRTDNINTQYGNTDQNLVAALYTNRDAYRASHGQWLTYLQTLAQSTIIQMLNDFAPLPQQTLPVAMAALIAQMKSDAQTVNKPTVGQAVTVGGSNVGNGTLIVSVLSSKGVQLDYSLAESVVATCSADGQGTGTAGQETFTLTSPQAESNQLAWDWPLGSGISLTLNAVDATVDAAAGNFLQNGAFKTWTNAGVGPDNWLIETGTVGTNIIQATGSNVYKGSPGLAFVGDSSTLLSIAQPFNATPSTAGNSGGSPLALTPNTQYALNFALKVSVAPAAGVLQIDLTDGNDAITSDPNGTQNTIQISLPGATTSFVLHNLFFRTPLVNPATGYRLRLHCPTAISTGTTLYHGHYALQQATPIYTGGPQAALFSGATNFILNDLFTAAISNNYAGLFQLYFDRVFGMKGLGLALASSGSPTILDSLLS